MKNLLFYLALGTTLLFSLNTQAQNSGTIHVTVTDSSGNPPQAYIGVFLYNMSFWPGGPIDSNSINFIDYTYTDTTGFTLYNPLQYNTASIDTLYVGVFDCNYNFHSFPVFSTSGTDTVHIQVPCIPDDCQALTGSKVDSSGTHAQFEAYSLTGYPTSQSFSNVDHTWTFSDGVSFSSVPTFWNQSNTDTVSRSLNSMPPNLEYCYSRMPSCATTCDSTNLGTAPTGPNCANGNICGNVVNSSNGQPANGNAVFVYNITQNGHPDSTLTGYTDYLYTDSAGDFTFSNLSANQGDSLLVGAVDCNYDLHWDYCVADSTQHCSVTVNLPCAATECQAIVEAREDNTGTFAVFESVLLRDAASVASMPTTEHLWNFSNNTSYSHGILISENQDTVMINLDSLPQNFEYCYTRYSGCSETVCDSSDIGTGGGTPGNPLTCNAHFFVDTANSMNYQGQVVMWENSTTSAGNIVDYHWDFGDNTTYNSQYPTHTYNDTDIYNVCLTITAVDGGDSCISTFCDSIGFDQNGNLVYKTEGEEGFTINVIDPETVGMEEASGTDPEFNLFPNPSRERAVLTWNPDYNIRSIELIGMNGSLLRNLKANQSGRVEFNDLSSGVYILRITGDDRVTPLKMIVK